MAPVPVTEDYYAVLEVEQTASLELIKRSYKKLALKVHPDKNSKNDATQAFILLGQAYEILMDASKRREYDFIYPSIARNRPSPPEYKQTPGPPLASTPQALSDAIQIAALQKAKQERGARWRIKRNIFDSSISELQKGVRQLEQDIKNLDSVLAAEVATKARENSWGTWLLSPIYKKIEDSEEEKARKDRSRQERGIEKNMKERRLELKRADVKNEESLFKKAKGEVEAADLCDDLKIGKIHIRTFLQKNQERQEREKIEREKVAKIRKQDREQRDRERQEKDKLETEKQQREYREAEQARRIQMERRAAEQRRQEEETRNWFNQSEGSTRQAQNSTCRHSGWWTKVQGRTACLECNEVWTYLLQCPGCAMKACPKCQRSIRGRTSRSNLPRARNSRSSFL